ncbi:MAG: MopE-related protein, partial [Sandaracinaceae bacterium]
RSILGSDCDDAMARVRPGNPELCNGLDDDCNGALDFRDVDYAEDEDSDGIPNVRCHPAGDCDDRDFFSGGDAPEVCGDRVDNDCDGMVDEAGAVAIDWYPDVDGDGWGDELGTAVSRCERVPRASFRVHDCDDSDPLRHPMAVDGCDGVDEDCDVAIDEDAAVHAVFRDLDGDGAGVDADLLLVCAAGAPAGYAATPSDCAPLDPSIGVRWADADGDGIGGGEPLTMCSVGTFATVGGDCDDGDAMVSSGCQELCNGVDDDGDGAIDETGASGCPHASGTSWTCMPGGTCAFGGCASGSANCDAIVSNGCESDLDTDAVNCGGCGMSCGAGADCVARSCTGTVIDVAVADQKSCALRDNGTVVCWGELPYDLGGYAGAPSVSTRMREMGAPMADATFIEVGPVVWCAGRSGDGLLHCSADLSDVYGVAGHGAPNVRPMGPTLVGGITEMGSYTWHACAVGPGGTVLCWGWNNEGVLGRGFASGAELLPDVVGGITGATAVCTGLVHSCALTPSGVLCWGRTSQEAFGTFGGSSPALFPVPVALSDLGTDPVIDIACGYINTCVLRASGRIDCSGQILPGPGFMNMTQIGTVPGGTEIAATDYSYCVASPTGAYCFGRDTHGVLGNGPGTDSMTPTAAIGLGAVTHVDVSTDHACAVTPAGEVWCWGDNNVGQVGAASTRSEVPLRVLNLP